MTCLVGRLRVKPGREPDFERLQSELARLALELEPGMIAYEVLKHRTQPGAYLLYLRFRDEASFTAHRATDHQDRLLPQILATLGEEMDMQFYDCIS